MLLSSGAPCDSAHRPDGSGKVNPHSAQGRPGVSDVWQTGHVPSGLGFLHQMRDDLEEYTRAMHRDLMDFVDHNARIVRNNLTGGTIPGCQISMAPRVLQASSAHFTRAGMRLMLSSSYASSSASRSSSSSSMPWIIR